MSRYAYCVLQPQTAMLVLTLIWVFCISVGWEFLGT